MTVRQLRSSGVVVARAARNPRWKKKHKTDPRDLLGLELDLSRDEVGIKT